MYLLGGTITKAIPFILLPILTHYLEPNEFGTLAIYQALLLISIAFVGINLPVNIARNFVKLSHFELARLIGTLVIILCCSTTIFFSLVSLWLFFYRQNYDISNCWILVLPLVSMFYITTQFYLSVLRNQERPLRFISLETTNSFLNVAISIILVVGLKLGWQGRAIGIILSTCSIGLFSLFLLRKQNLLIFRFDISAVKKILSISLPLIPHALGGVIIVLGDRFFIEALLNKDAVGIYVVGCSFGMIVNLFVEAFSNAWSPWFYRQMADADNAFEKKKRIVQFTYIYFCCIVLIAFLITAISQFFLPVLVAEEYQSASEFIMWVALGYAFRGMYTMIFPYFVFMGKTRFIGICTGGAALVNMVLNYFLICEYGAVGAARATLLAWFFMFLFSWIYSIRICRMPWLNWRV